jgi:hypothetical protein
LKKVKKNKLDDEIQQFHWPIQIFSYLITCTFATRIYNCKSSSKDATWCPMAYEPLSKLKKQLHFHPFWDAIKNR